MRTAGCAVIAVVGHLATGCLGFATFVREDGTETQDICEMTVYLEQGMKIAEATKLLGRPDSLKKVICGTSTPRPWLCQIARYEARKPWHGLRYLSLYFEDAAEGVALASWECN